MPNVVNTLTAIASALDGLSIGFYALDTADRAICWNRSFLAFFPEHAGRIESGEPYADNLRRFYDVRLSPDERPLLERYISEGLARSREQRAPYLFEHRGRKLRVSSMAIPNVGRVRLWREASAPDDDAEGLIALALPSRFRGSLPADGLAMLESLADGVSLVDGSGMIVWTNEPFRVMYDLPDATRIAGANFPDLYRAAWDGHRDGDEGLPYEQGALTLIEHLRFAGAPFELPLPGERWTRVVHHDAQDGMRYFAHVDITGMKRQQAALEAAEQRARQSEQRYRLLAEYSCDVIVSLVADRIDYISPAVMELLGQRPEALVGLPIGVLVTDEDRSRVRQFVLARAPGTLEFRAQHADGRSTWFEASARAVPAVADAAIAVDPRGRSVLNLRDIDQRKRVEAALQVASERLTLLGDDLG